MLSGSLDGGGDPTVDFEEDSMLIEGALALTVALLACDNHPTRKAEELPKGPNVRTGARSAVEAREIVLVKKIGWSPDGSLVHYWLQFQNRRCAAKKGLMIIGVLVDVSSGKTLRTYQVEQKGYMEAALKKRWDGAKPRAWGDALVKRLGLVPAAKKSTRAPGKAKGAGKLRLRGVKTRLGWVAAWRLGRWFGWRWQPGKRRTKPGDKIDPWLELQHRPKGAKGAKAWKTLHRHQPLLDYHAALGHLFTWEKAREREDSEEMDVHWCAAGLSDPKCQKELRDHALTERHKYAFTGEVWTFWSPRADAVLVFWDDKELVGVDTDKAMGIYRSYVTVHALAARPPTTLVSPEASPVKQAVASGTMAPTTKLSGVQKASDGSKTSKNKAKAKSKASGCGCQTRSGGAFPGLVVLWLLVLAAGRRARRRRSSPRFRKVP